MKGLAAISTLALLIGFTGCCFAADPGDVSIEQATTEALENREFANVLWVQAHQACSVKDWQKQSSIMQVINNRLKEQPTNNLKYSARFVHSSCRQMLLNVSSINGACFTNPPTQHEIDYSEKVWKEDSLNCDAEIANPDLTLAEPAKKQTEAEWEAERKKEGVSDEDIAFMKHLRSL
ncbi:MULTISPECIES: hypothetical protein [Pseudomonas fluorescens group]|uniref:hypothetical protein n=1 Tax=Pseudomonas fluorescens group TaxID=136843 RepID=UPI0005C600A6|nr:MULTISPECIES: hypothetical protein [Pseudomonas fluorescens group]RTY72292.1 hypothetical protein EKA83_24275 [Pseudomonas veronii]